MFVFISWSCLCFSSLDGYSFCFVSVVCSPLIHCLVYVVIRLFFVCSGIYLSMICLFLVFSVVGLVEYNFSQFKLVTLSSLATFFPDSFDIVFHLSIRNLLLLLWYCFVSFLALLSVCVVVVIVCCRCCCSIVVLFKQSDTCHLFKCYFYISGLFLFVSIGLVWFGLVCLVWFDLI